VFLWIPINSARTREPGKASEGCNVPFVINAIKLLHTCMCSDTGASLSTRINVLYGSIWAVVFV
jgi:hypothetical protein